VTDVILHPTEETSLDSGFARRSYDHLTRGDQIELYPPSQTFCLGIGSKLLDRSAWMFRCQSTRCFLETWVTFDVQLDSDDANLDLSLATWVPDPTEGSLDLSATTLIIECVY
jgi:hypothetical protein